MKIVCIDNHVLLWGLREITSPGQEDMIPRTKQFLASCKEQGVQILVPSMVLAELLTAIEDRHYALTTNLLSASFPVPPFDTAAAHAFAKLWRQRQNSGLIDALKKEHGATRQELKADCMIVATALVQRAEALYSHDNNLRKFANGALPVLEVPQLPKQPGLPF